MEEKKKPSPLVGLTREAEEAHLAQVIRIAQKNLEGTEQQIEKLTEDLDDLLENYETRDKETMVLWHNAESQLQENRHDLTRRLKARRKPYFGRIDFRDPKQKEDESYYIGRVGIAKNGSDLVVVDWRAPISSVYYENSIGTCTYDVKNEGTYEIDLKRKRTYEIQEDRLLDYFDSDVVANDDLLNKYLAKNKKAVLGEIIATIQKEQNDIIRTSPKTNLIVQGVAGSGKTTVAMHRISYILYNYEQFRPEDFYIIGSNRILLNYITSVLPDLDVYGIRQMTMEQLLIRLLYEDWDGEKYQVAELDRNDRKACAKSGVEWFRDLEEFCRGYERSVVPAETIYLRPGKELMTSESIENYLDCNPGMSMQSKINMLNETVMSKLENEIMGKEVSYTAAEKRELQKTYRSYFGKNIWKGSIYELYEDFLEQQREKGYEIFLHGNEYDIYDLAALAYIYKRIKETDGIREASHVIIDEAQDFGMMAYGALTYCMRGCTYTIMGDVSQNIHYGYGLNDWEELKKLVLTGTFDHFGLLKKSYRNTVEISGFATEILRHGDFSIYPVEPIIRHGKEVSKLSCRDQIEMLQKAVITIRGWEKEGYDTIAVICRDEAESQEVSQALATQLQVADSHLETAEFGHGVIVLPVEYSKGLEFDAVLLFNPSEEHYPSEDQYVKLLYVAATRALHELTVVYMDNLTDLIASPVSEDKKMISLEHEIKPKVRRYVKKRIEPEEHVVDTQEELGQRKIVGPKRIAAQKKAVEVVPDLLQEKWLREKRLEEQKRKAEQKKTESLKKLPEQRVSAFGTRTSVYSKRQSTVGRKISGKQDSGVAGSNNLNLQTGKFVTTSQNEINLAETNSVEMKKAQAIRVMKSAGVSNAAPQPINTSPHQYGDIPDNRLLTPKGHGSIDSAIRWVKKSKDHMDFISRYGTLRLTPVTEEVMRVQFQKGQNAEFKPGYWNRQPKEGLAWITRDTRTQIELSTEKLQVHVDKRTGALQFLDFAGKPLLSEKAALPRQMELDSSASQETSAQTWNYFDWGKNEKIYAKGILSDSFDRMNQKARYISFGQKKLRMPLVISELGYGIGVAAEGTVLCCGSSQYGTYIYTEGEERIDYYFLYGKTKEKILELYLT